MEKNNNTNEERVAFVAQVNGMVGFLEMLKPLCKVDGEEGKAAEIFFTKGIEGIIDFLNNIKVPAVEAMEKSK